MRGKSSGELEKCEMMGVKKKSRRKMIYEEYLANSRRNDVSVETVKVCVIEYPFVGEEKKLTQLALKDVG